MKIRSKLYKIVWLFAIIIGWELTTRYSGVSPLIMPSMGTILKALLNNIQNGKLLIQVGQSLLMVFVGISIGGLIGLLLAFLDYYFIAFRHLFELLSAMLHPLPGIAVLPIVILWFGIGLDGIFVIILHAVVWSFYLNMKAGFLATDKNLIEGAMDIGCTPIRVFWLVILPLSKPFIQSGIRIGWSRGWRALISAEMVFGAISSVGGIGWFMYERRSFMDSPGMYAGILIVVIIGILIEDYLFGKWLLPTGSHPYSE